MPLKSRATGLLPTSPGTIRSDDTVKVLSAFIGHLPPRGKRMMLHLIQEETPDKKLFDLSFHLNTTILIPGKFVYYDIFCTSMAY